MCRPTSISIKESNSHSNRRAIPASKIMCFWALFAIVGTSCHAYFKRPHIDTLVKSANKICGNKTGGAERGVCAANLFTKLSSQRGDVRGVENTQEYSFMVGNEGITLNVRHIKDCTRGTCQSVTKFVPL